MTTFALLTGAVSSRYNEDMRKNAFTLIEMLVVVSIIMLTATFSFVSYFRLQDRQLVENTAKEIINHLREVQNRARQGDRGTGDCAASSTNLEYIAKGNLKLQFWLTTLDSNQIESHPVCTNTTGSGTLSGDSKTIPISNGQLRLYCQTGPSAMDECSSANTTAGNEYNKYYYFHTLFNSVNKDNKESRPASDAGSVTTISHYLVLTNNDGLCYGFGVRNGTIIEGCMCDKLGATTPNACLTKLKNGEC